MQGLYKDGWFAVLSGKSCDVKAVQPQWHDTVFQKLKFFQKECD